MMKEEFSQSRLSQIFLDNLPGVALLLRPWTREIVASNQAAVKVGAVPGTKCFATWMQRDNPCPWCLAPELWKTGQAQHLEVEAGVVVWDAYWAPVGPDLYMHYAFDITERKRMEDPLRDSAETMRALLNAIPESIFLIDADRAIVAANETLVQRLGKSIEEVVGAKIAEILPAEVAKRRKAHADEVFQTGRAVRFEDMREGRSFDNFLHPILDAEGMVAKLAVFSLDITERRQVEQALREREKSYRSLFENMLEGFAYCRMLFDDQGQPVDWVYLEVNRAFARLTGLENIVGRRVTEAIPGIKESAPELFEIYGRVSLTGQPERFEIYLKPLARWLHITAYSPGKEHFIAVFEDITDRKRAELALRESEQKLANIIDFLPDATLVIDKEGKVIAWNRAMEEMTGIKAADMVGRGNFEYGLPFYGKRRPILIDLVLQPREELAKYTGLQREGLSISGVAHFSSFRGKEAYLFGKASILLDSQGKISGAIESVRDITDRRKAEAERLRFSKLKSLGLLAGGIAHDFNNILTAIIGSLSLAMLNPKDAIQVRGRLQEAEVACQQAQTLARQLLTFAKGRAPVKTITSVAATINESVTLACRGTRVRCEFQAADDLWLVEADPGQIGQVFQNLIINAIQAMPAGGTIEIHAANHKQEAAGKPLLPGNYVKITIRDQGLGIPAEYLPKIFDPYFTTKQSGSGLGLATAYSIIKSHHGEISVKSTLGVGTTFHIYLPASDRKIVLLPGQDKAWLGGKGKILVMDDEEMVRQVLERMLANLGYEAELAQDGAEAIEKFSEAEKAGDKFAAVILDLTVPGGIGGKETMEKLLKIDPQVKAIVSSGYSDDPIMADPKKYGFSGVIAKPYKVMDLNKILHDIIGQKI
jgi:PAS domain S-box-containing protein